MAPKTSKSSLHPVQDKLLELLRENIDEPLTIREIQERLGLSSPSVVAHHITALEKKGVLKRNPSNPKDYQILENGPEKQIAYLSLYGLAHCGPKGSILDGDPVDKIPLPERLISFPSNEAFLVKAKGDSMEPKIHDGDLVIARKTNAPTDGRIFVCINDGEALIKKVHLKGKNRMLISLNASYEPLLAENDFRVVGEVRSVFSHSVF